MTRPASDPLTDIPPAARDTVASLLAAPTIPVKVLVSGGIGTGKSSVLAAIRTALREAGGAVLTRPPRDGDDSAAAVVIDDAQLLDDEELGQLGERVADPASTVVVAAEPLAHHPALRSLATAMERENPVVSLGGLSPAEVNRIATETLGAPPTPEIIRSLMVATAGLPFLLRPAIAAAGSPDGEAPATAIMQAAKFALIERLRRLDEPVLDTLLVSSLSPELGPDDVAAALRSEKQTQHLVDHARARGLMEPSTTSRSCGRCTAASHGSSGTARHHRHRDGAAGAAARDRPRCQRISRCGLAEHGMRDDRAGPTSSSTWRPALPARRSAPPRPRGCTGPPPMRATAADGTPGRRARDDRGLHHGRAAGRRAARLPTTRRARDGGPASPPASPCTTAARRQAADLFRWLGPYPDAFVSASGAIVAVAAGDLERRTARR